jgi:hypothetical protein
MRNDSVNRVPKDSREDRFGMNTVHKIVRPVTSDEMIGKTARLWHCLKLHDRLERLPSVESKNVLLRIMLRQITGDACASALG